MSNEKQVEQLTTYMANFIAHIAKKLPDDVIAKLTELRDKEDSPLSKTIYDTMFRNQELAVTVQAARTHEYFSSGLNVEQNSHLLMSLRCF